MLARTRSARPGSNLDASRCDSGARSAAWSDLRLGATPDGFAGDAEGAEPAALMDRGSVCREVELGRLDERQA